MAQNALQIHVFLISCYIF